MLSGENKEIGVGFTIEDLSDPEFDVPSKIGAESPEFKPPPSTRPLPVVPGSTVSAPSVPTHKSSSSPNENQPAPRSPTTIPLNLPGTSNTAEFQRARLMSLPMKMQPFDPDEYKRNQPGSNSSGRGKGRGRGSGLGTTIMVDRAASGGPTPPPKPSHLFKSLN